MFRLIAELRKVQPELFVNMTTGTWPSVYYLWLGDSTWRGARTWASTGPGSKRQQWVNYRDADTYRGVVCRGPLYPINSLMTQGVVEARFGYATQLAMEPDEFRDEVRSFFASGTCTQELYVTPQKLSGRNWDDLAEAARWSQSNADVLVDTHWVGGDPGKGEAYGWASWSPRQGILALRNPSDKPGRITLDVARAFVAPGAPQSYALKSPWKEDAAAETIVLDAGREHTFEIETVRSPRVGRRAQAVTRRCAGCVSTHLQTEDDTWCVQTHLPLECQYWSVLPRNVRRMFGENSTTQVKDVTDGGVRQEHEDHAEICRAIDIPRSGHLKASHTTSTVAGHGVATEVVTVTTRESTQMLNEEVLSLLHTCLFSECNSIDRVQRGLP